MMQQDPQCLVELVVKLYEVLGTDDKQNAFIELFPEVKENAQTLANEWENGKSRPLTGLLVSVKDLIACKDHQLTAASGMLAGYISPFSATVVDRLTQAGALIVGRTNCDEFGMGSSGEYSIYGPVKNALDDSAVAGGSSSGAAVSVALDWCHLALGTDTGGSVRLPAAFNQIYGFKPTYGRLSRYGVLAYASSFDQVGLLSKDPKVIRQVMQHLSFPDPHDMHTAKWTPFSEPSDVEAIPTVALDPVLFQPPFVSEKHADGWSQFSWETILGHVSSCQLPGIEQAIYMFHVLAPAEAASNLARYDGIRYGHTTDAGSFHDKVKNARNHGFGAEVKRRILNGNYFLSEQDQHIYAQAMHSREALKQTYDDLFQQCDFILMPASYSEPFKLGENKGKVVNRFLEDRFLVLANLLGCPAGVVPVNNIQGLSLGLQVMAPKGEDENLLDYMQLLTEIFSL